MQNWLNTIFIQGINDFIIYAQYTYIIYRYYL